MKLSWLYIKSSSKIVTAISFVSILYILFYLCYYNCFIVDNKIHLDVFLNISVSILTTCFFHFIVIQLPRIKILRFLHVDFMKLISINKRFIKEIRKHTQNMGENEYPTYEELTFICEKLEYSKPINIPNLDYKTLGELTRKTQLRMRNKIEILNSYFLFFDFKIINSLTKLRNSKFLSDIYINEYNYPNQEELKEFFIIFEEFEKSIKSIPYQLLK